MVTYLMNLPDALLFLLLCIFFIGVSFFCVILLKKLFPHVFRYRDNAVLGNVAALIGIIYGVLAGLTALYLINNVNAAAQAVQQEANAAANLYRDTGWIQGSGKILIQTEIKNYLKQVINVDWQDMATGKKVNAVGDEIIEKIVNEIFSVNFIGINQAMIGRDMLQEAKALYDARQERISLSYSQLSSPIWEVILIGTFLTLAINFLFKLNIYLHLVAVSAAAIMATSMIYLLITLDRPFQGDFVVNPDALKSVLALIESRGEESTPHPQINSSVVKSALTT